ncbi:MAG: hypothetical protein VCA34_11460, partial [Roseibacillus sp.]
VAALVVAAAIFRSVAALVVTAAILRSVAALVVTATIFRALAALAILIAAFGLVGGFAGRIALLAPSGQSEGGGEGNNDQFDFHGWWRFVLEGHSRKHGGRSY